MSPLLTQGEYDDLPQEAKDALAQVVRFPHHDVHDHSYRRRFGPYRNGELYGDPIVRQRVGYGTDSPLTSHPVPTPPISALVEKFKTLDPSIWDISGVASIVNEQLVLDATDDYSGIISHNVYNATESSLSIELVSGSPVYAPVLADITNADHYIYWWIQDGFAQVWYKDHVMVADAMLWQGPYDPVAYRFLRIREHSGQTFWEHSRDGRNWLTDYSQPDLIDMTALTGSTFAIPPGIITLDNVNFVP